MAASVVSLADVRVSSIMRAWRSAPAATSPTAFAISSTARPASFEDVAICSEALDSRAVAADTSEMTDETFSVMRLNAIPSASRSERGSIVLERSRSTIRSAAFTISLR